MKKVSFKIDRNKDGLFIYYKNASRLLFGLFMLVLCYEPANYLYEIMSMESVPQEIFFEDLNMTLINRATPGMSKNEILFLWCIGMILTIGILYELGKPKFSKKSLIANSNGLKYKLCFFFMKEENTYDWNNIQTFSILEDKDNSSIIHTDRESITFKRNNSYTKKYRLILNRNENMSISPLLNKYDLDRLINKLEIYRKRFQKINN